MIVDFFLIIFGHCLYNFALELCVSVGNVFFFVRLHLYFCSFAFVVLSLVIVFPNSDAQQYGWFVRKFILFKTFRVFYIFPVFLSFTLRSPIVLSLYRSPAHFIVWGKKKISWKGWSKMESEWKNSTTKIYSQYLIVWSLLENRLYFVVVTQILHDLYWFIRSMVPKHIAHLLFHFEYFFPFSYFVFFLSPRS